MKLSHHTILPHNDFEIGTTAMNAPIPTTTEARALALLGSGVAPETVAASLGVSASRISQLLSDENFAASVAELRFKNLAKHNERDASYDELEDALLERMKDCIPLMHRPMELLKAIQIINAAKRRGQSTPESIIEKQSIINLVVPVQIIQKFQTNIQGQVTSINDQSLLTIQSGSLDSLLKSKKGGNENGLTISQGNAVAA
jgi:hypothetical protein